MFPCGIAVALPQEICRLGTNGVNPVGILTERGWGAFRLIVYERTDIDRGSVAAGFGSGFDPAQYNCFKYRLRSHLCFSCL